MLHQLEENEVVSNKYLYEYWPLDEKEYYKRQINKIVFHDGFCMILSSFVDYCSIDMIKVL